MFSFCALCTENWRQNLDDNQLKPVQKKEKKIVSITMSLHLIFIMALCYLLYSCAPSLIEHENNPIISYYTVLNCSIIEDEDHLK